MCCANKTSHLRLLIHCPSSPSLHSRQHICLRFLVHDRSSSLLRQLECTKGEMLLTWWFGKINESASTTFSLRPAAKTTTSAISSGVNGSQPLFRSVLPYKI